MNKLELAVDAARNDDMERVIKLLEEVLAEQAEQEPVMITPGGGAFPFAVVGELEQAEQEPCKECGAKQAQIDRLMLEYCPDEMTPEQMKEWGNNQRPVEQAEQEPVAWMNTNGAVNKLREAGWAMNAAPVRTKDLTDVEIAALVQRHTIDGKIMPFALCEAVIAADREKNK